MKKYIDAEAFKRVLIEEKSFYPAIVKNALEKMPAADVKEVVHAKWKIYTDEYDCEYMCCSHCKSGFYPVDEDTIDETVRTAVIGVLVFNRFLNSYLGLHKSPPFLK